METYKIYKEKIDRLREIIGLSDKRIFSVENDIIALDKRYRENIITNDNEKEQKELKEQLKNAIEFLEDLRIDNQDYIKALNDFLKSDFFLSSIDKIYSEFSNVIQNIDDENKKTETEIYEMYDSIILKMLKVDNNNRKIQEYIKTYNSIEKNKKKKRLVNRRVLVNDLNNYKYKKLRVIDIDDENIRLKRQLDSEKRMIKAKSELKKNKKNIEVENESKIV